MQNHKGTTGLARIGVPLLLAVAVIASQGQTTAGQQSQQRQQTPVFRATADYISTDVIVHDKDGKFVPNLSLSDFVVYEDGVRQTVTNFIPVIGGRALGSASTTPMAAAPMMEGLVLPKAKPAADQSGRIFIIFIDDMHLMPLDTPRVRKLLEQIRDELLHENDLVGLVSTGFSSISVDISYDFGHRRFNEALGKVMGSGMTPTDIITANQTAEGPAGLRYNANVAFSTAYDLLGQAAKITNRRKAFIYVSEGYSFNPFKDARFKRQQEMYGTDTSSSSTNSGNNDPDQAGTANNTDVKENPFEKQGQQFAEADLIAQLAELTREARRANVTFYTIDPRGLNAGPDMQFEPLSFAEWRDFMMTTTSSLMVLGDETGGFCICNNNDFKRGIQRIDNETSDYYILGYSSTNPDPLKLRRTIKIEVLKPGIDLVYKSDYALAKPPKPKKVK